MCGGEILYNFDVQSTWCESIFFSFFLKGKASAQGVQQAWHAACAAVCWRGEGRPVPPGNTSPSLEHFWVKAFRFRCRLTFLFALHPLLLLLGTAPREMRLTLVVCCCMLGCSQALLGELGSLCCSCLSVCLAGML